MGILDRFSLSGKTALVTGAGRGLGQGMALALAEAGADIAIAELDLPAAEETAGMIRERGRRALAFKSDVTDFEAPSLAVLVRDLFETGCAAPGLGIAAPHIAVNFFTCDALMIGTIPGTTGTVTPRRAR